MREKKEPEYISIKTLASKLDIAEKTLFNNSFKIKGRVKIDKHVRFDWKIIDSELKAGRGLYA